MTTVKATAERRCPHCRAAALYIGRDQCGAYLACRVCGWLRPLGPQQDGPVLDFREMMAGPVPDAHHISLLARHPRKPETAPPST